MAAQVMNIECPTYPCQAGVEDATFMAVITMDDSEQYAVYAGIVKLDPSLFRADAAAYTAKRAAAAEWLMHHGSKLTHRDAQRFFPGVPEKRYRA